MRVSLVLPLLVALPGCGSGTPDLATVKKNMASDQLALGEPIVNSVGMVLVPIPAGEFQMGTAENKESLDERFKKLLQEPKVQEMLKSGKITKASLRERLEQSARSEAERKQFTGPESPQHLVKITKPYYLSVHEVTQQQYEKVMEAWPWQGKHLVEEGDDYAATYVSWDDAVEFCRKLSEQESVEYRLPTEAEWEYACRAGTTTTYSFGDDGRKLGDYAWYDQNAYKDGEKYAHRVGRKLPNAWALYDMHGNAWEWCQDWYAPYHTKEKEALDPAGPEKGWIRVWRGGGFSDPVINVRSATRLSYGREHYRPEFLTGFRVARAFNSSR